VDVQFGGQGASGYVLVFRTLSVSTEACCDFLSIYDGSSSSNRSLAALSGSTNAADVLSSANALTLRFTTDSVNAGAGVRGVLWLLSRLDVCNASGPLWV
jgi:hypothetical protein